MILPGVLEETFEKATERIRSVEEIAKIIHVDIVDGELTAGKTFLDIEKFNSFNTTADIQIHLMVKNPTDYLKRAHFLFPMFTKKIRGVSTVITQAVDYKETRGFLILAKKLGYKIGLSLNSNQEQISLDPFLNTIDLVDFMSVIPGKQGGAFIPSVLDKIRKFKTEYPALLTQIDGGIKEYNFQEVLNSGVDNVIIGSGIFNSENPKNKFLEFSKAAHGSTTNS